MMLRSFILSVGLGLSPLPLFAQSPQDLAQVEVLSGWEIGGGRQMAALKITLAPGWKTYWRSPGDAGVPPIFDWSGSENLQALAIHWPTPEVFDLNGMMTLGYHDGVVIPIEVGVTGPGALLGGQIDMGICEEICVPVILPFQGTLTPKTSRNPEIVAALVDQPVSGPLAGAGPARCRVEPTKDGMIMHWSAELPPQGGEEVVVIEAGKPGIWTSQTDSRRSGSHLEASAEMVIVTGAAVIDRSLIRATILGAHSAVEIVGCAGG